MAKNIPFTTIDRSNPESASIALNLRPSRAGLTPVPLPQGHYYPLRPTYIHAAPTFSNVLSIDVSGGKTVIKYLDKSPAGNRRGNLAPLQSITVNSEAISICHVGNTLILNTKNGMHYLLFKDEAYLYLGDKPPVPKIRFGYTDADAKVNKNDYTLDVGFASTNAWNNEFDKYTSKGEFEEAFTRQALADFDACFNKMQHHITNQGLLPDYPVMVRCAVRLYDGSYILHTPPLLLSKNDCSTSTKYNCRHRDVAADTKKITPGVSIKAKELSYFLDYDIGNWTDIVESVDIFITPLILPFKIGETSGSVLDLSSDSLSWDKADSDSRATGRPLDTKDYEYRRNKARNANWAGSAAREFINVLVKHCSMDFITRNKLPEKFTRDQLRRKILDQSSFFRLKSISGNKLKSNQFISLKSEIKEKWATIAAQSATTLPDDYNSHNRVSAGCSFVYNQRLHLGDIHSSLFEGFTPDYFIIEDRQSASDYATPGFTSTELRKDVIHNVTAVESQFTVRGYISPLLYYPSPDARKMTLGATYCDKSRMYASTFNLEKHDFLNGAYYLSPFLDSPQLATSHQLPSPQSSSYHEPNRLLTSPVSNPFSFDFSASNLISNKTITAIAAASMAVSQGQTGRFPLYVFTSSGIYALPVTDTGEYSLASMISADVAVADHLIVPTHNGVAFCSTRGLLLLNGTSANLLSLPVDNDSSSNIHRLLDIDHPLAFKSLRGIVADNPTNFSMAYDYAHSEIVIADKSTNKSLVCTMSGQWYLRDLYSADFLSDYPRLYNIDNLAMYDLSTETHKDSHRNYLPFKYATNAMGMLNFGKINGIRAVVNASGMASLSVAAANIPSQLRTVKSISLAKPANPIPTLHLDRIPSSFRNFAFLIQGQMSNGTLNIISADTQ